MNEIDISIVKESMIGFSSSESILNSQINQSNISVQMTNTILNVSMNVTEINVTMPQPLRVAYIVDTIEERNAIPSASRFEGMIVYVSDDMKNYQLIGGVENANREKFGSATWGEIKGNIGDQTDLAEIHQKQELLSAWKFSFDTQYKERTIVNGLLTSIDIWEDGTKETKLFTKTIHYTGSQMSQVVITDEITNVSLVIVHDIDEATTYSFIV